MSEKLWKCQLRPGVRRRQQMSTGGEAARKRNSALVMQTCNLTDVRMATFNVTQQQEAEQDKDWLLSHCQLRLGSLGAVREKNPKKRPDFLVTWHFGLIVIAVLILFDNKSWWSHFVAPDSKCPSSVNKEEKKRVIKTITYLVLLTDNDPTELLGGQTMPADENHVPLSKQDSRTEDRMLTITCPYSLIVCRRCVYICSHAPTPQGHGGWDTWVSESKREPRTSTLAEDHTM